MQMFKQILVPGQNGVPAGDETSWWLSTLTKGVATLAGLVGIPCGIITLMSIDLACVFAGSLIALEGLIIVLIEAPCFCVFLDFSQVPSNLMDKKPQWVRATIYLIFAALPFSFCTSVSGFFACGLYVISSAMYLMQSLGKKASLEEMRASAAAMQSNQPFSPLQSMTSSMTSVLVNNEQPVATKPTGYFNQTTINNAPSTGGDSGFTGVVY
ncbi:Calcium channel flower [Halotydeus destructor]|nr:Calcium channel flower [Halotydeus destructor]